MATSMSAFDPIRIGPLQLRNRFFKSATNEGMAKGGVPSKMAVEHPSPLDGGGVGPVRTGRPSLFGGAPPTGHGAGRERSPPPPRRADRRVSSPSRCWPSPPVARFLWGGGF